MISKDDRIEKLLPRARFEQRVSEITKATQRDLGRVRSKKRQNKYVCFSFPLFLLKTEKMVKEGSTLM